MIPDGRHTGDAATPAIVGSASPGLTGGSSARDRRAERRVSGVEELSAATLTIAGGDLALHARLNADYALTGRLLGAGAVGVYTIAWQTSAGPELYIAAFTGRVGFAVFSRLHADRDHLRRVFLADLRVIAAVAVPLSAGAVLVALGGQWRPAVGPVIVLFVLQLVRAVRAPGLRGHIRQVATTWPGR